MPKKRGGRVSIILALIAGGGGGVGTHRGGEAGGLDGLAPRVPRRPHGLAAPLRVPHHPRGDGAAWTRATEPVRRGRPVICRRGELRGQGSTPTGGLQTSPPLGLQGERSRTHFLGPFWFPVTITLAGVHRRPRKAASAGDQGGGSIGRTCRLI